MPGGGCRVLGCLSISGASEELLDSLNEPLPFSPFVQTGGGDAVLELEPMMLVVAGSSSAEFKTGLTGRGTGGFTGCVPQLVAGKLATIIAVLGVMS